MRRNGMKAGVPIVDGVKKLNMNDIATGSVTEKYNQLGSSFSFLVAASILGAGLGGGVGEAS